MTPRNLRKQRTRLETKPVTICNPLPAVVFWFLLFEELALLLVQDLIGELVV